MVIEISRVVRKIAKIIKYPFAEEVLVLGDSHTEAFNAFGGLDLLFSIAKYRFTVCSVGGATASGLKNLNSKTKALRKFQNAIQRYKGKKVFIMLGEVDTGFAIWLKSQTQNIPVEESYQKALDNYFDFVVDLSKKFSVYVFSTPLPTISDDQSAGEIAFKRSAINISQRERTNLTKRFNNDLESFCKKLGLQFVSLDEDSINPQTGIVRDELINKNPLDHHYDLKTYCKLLALKISTLT